MLAAALFFENVVTLHLYLIEITTFRVPRGAFNDGSHLKEKIIDFIVIYVTAYFSKLISAFGENVKRAYE